MWIRDRSGSLFRSGPWPVFFWSFGMLEGSWRMIRDLWLCSGRSWGAGKESAHAGFPSITRSQEKKNPKLSNTGRDDQLTGRFEADKTGDGNGDETWAPPLLSKRISPIIIFSYSSLSNWLRKRRTGSSLLFLLFHLFVSSRRWKERRTFSALVITMPRRKQDCPKRMKCKYKVPHNHFLSLSTIQFFPTNSESLVFVGRIRIPKSVTDACQESWKSFSGPDGHFLPKPFCFFSSQPASHFLSC